MWKVQIQNIITNQPYGSTFETEALADAWISQQVASDGWGKKAQEIPASSFTSSPLFDSFFEKEISPEKVIDLFESDNDGDFALDQYGNKIKIGTKTIPAETETWVRLKPEYTITKTDISAELAAKAEVARLAALGEQAQKFSDLVYNVVAGFNIDSGKTTAEIDAMTAALSDIKLALQDRRPDKALGFIMANNDPNLAVLKTLILSIYSSYGLI